jgi:Xaa-Pro aminopeptidase
LAGGAQVAQRGGGARLVILALSSRDPDIAGFLGAAKLGACLLLWDGAGVPVLGYLSAMEREEAAATGCRLLGPRELDAREPAEHEPTAADRLAGWLTRAFEHCGWEPGPVELAGRSPAGDVLAACRQLESAGWSFSSGHERLLRHRRTKSATELAEARAAAAATMAAMRAVASRLAAATVATDGRLVLEGAPLDAGRLRAAVAGVLAAAGLEQPEGNILAVGAAAGVPHSRGADQREIRAGEPVVVDLFPKRRLFADCTRTFCVGEAPEELREAHALVRSAVERSLDRAVAGACGWELQEAVCASFESAGYATPRSSPGATSGYVHGLGHGVGFELHELPSFRRGAGADGVLAEGDLFTLEPGLYAPERGWGVRLEELCCLGPAGLERLTPLPFDLDPRGW